MKIKLFSNIEIPIPESYKDCILLIKSDYFRYTGKHDNFFNVFIYTFKQPPFAFTFWLRMCSYKSKVPLLGILIFGISKLIKTLKGRKRGLMISERMPLGYGLYLSHGFGTIVNPSAVIGNNCTLCQFTTIGAVEGDAAVVGNNVYIGPSVCLVENVYIGNNSIIGAGAVVVKDVPNETIAAGVPAKIISINKNKRYINNPWIRK